jgi:hypothetical protein
MISLQGIFGFANRAKHLSALFDPFEGHLKEKD